MAGWGETCKNKGHDAELQFEKRKEEEMRGGLFKRRTLRNKPSVARRRWYEEEKKGSWKERVA
jgi:hypothetical protein